jgi:hypothetical protein
MNQIISGEGGREGREGGRGGGREGGREGGEGFKSLGGGFNSGAGVVGFQFLRGLGSQSLKCVIPGNCWGLSSLTEMIKLTHGKWVW